jgi:hypothetical protein
MIRPTFSAPSRHDAQCSASSASFGSCASEMVIEDLTEEEGEAFLAAIEA